MTVGGCSIRSHSPVLSGPLDGPAEWKEGQIIETSSGRPVSMDELMQRIDQQEVVYVGEEHHNRYHIKAALTVLKHLTDGRRRPLLAMEMFGWESQPELDRYVRANELSREEFIDLTAWKQNWGGPFEDYEDLVSYAKAHQLLLVALNPPKRLIRLVATQGIAKGRLDPEWTRWGMQQEEIVDDPIYRQQLMRQLRACHDGGSDAMYESMYEASMVRDEGMAKSIVEAVRVTKESGGGPVVSYTGGGHIQYSLPVPKRVTRRLSNQVRQLSIYLTAYESGRIEELREMLKGKIADYIWLTPVSAHGPPRRCR